jgi:hypothetical protein
LVEADDRALRASFINVDGDVIDAVTIPSSQAR